MAKFALGQPIMTTVPSIVVDAGLPVGLHSFQLEVLTDAGRRSLPDIKVVQVQASSAPAGLVVSPAGLVVSPTLVVGPS
jgi:hypothetical protein